MKKSIVTLAIAGIISLALVTGCNTSTDKVENAKENVTDAKLELESANEYLADMETYKKESAAQFESNMKSIAKFKASVENEKEEIKRDYLEKIVLLEKMNNDAKKKLDDYKADGKEKWEAFKAEFYHDMAGLGKAFKSVSVNNVK